MNQDMHQSKDNKFIPMTSMASGTGEEVADDVYYVTDQIANVVFVGTPSSDDWVLIDTGLPKQTDIIRTAVKERLGRFIRGVEGSSVCSYVGISFSDRKGKLSRS